MKKSKEELQAALQKHLPVAEYQIASAKEMLKTVEIDFEDSRDCMKRLITSCEAAIQILAVVAEDSEDLRSFDVLSTLIKTAADLNKQMMEMNKQRQDLHSNNGDKTEGDTNNTQNNFFVGTTVELQKMIAANSKTLDV